MWQPSISKPLPVWCPCAPMWCNLIQEWFMHQLCQLHNPCDSFEPAMWHTCDEHTIDPRDTLYYMYTYTYNICSNVRHNFQLSIWHTCDANKSSMCQLCDAHGLITVTQYLDNTHTIPIMHCSCEHDSWANHTHVMPMRHPCDNHVKYMDYTHVILYPTTILLIFRTAPVGMMHTHMTVLYIWINPHDTFTYVQGY